MDIGKIQDTSVFTRESEIKQSSSSTEPAKQVKEESGKEKEMPIQKTDSYVSHKNDEQRITGLYSVKRKSGGRVEIKYEDPKKDIESENGEEVVEESDLALQKEKSSNQDVKQLIINRDKIKMQIKREKGNTVKIESLRKKLSQIEKQIKNIK